MEARIRRRRIDELLELTALSTKREAYVDGLSRGMKQRLCLARALMHNPQLLILDEPASGMDPQARAEMRLILKHIGEMGKTVLISSHILPELSELCSSMTILKKGRAIFSGSVDELERRMHHAPLTIHLAQDVEGDRERKAWSILQNAYGTEPEKAEALCWRIASQEDRGKDAHVLGELLRMGVPVCAFGRERATLEQVFMEVTRNDDQSDF